MKRHALLVAALLAAAPVFAGVVINEIHYNPSPGADDYYEFLELHNTGAAAADIGGWTLSGVTHTFDAGASVPAGGYLVVAVNADTLMARFGLTGVIQWSSGALSNSGEALTLTDTASNVVDLVTYDDGDCWPTTPDGSGPSLELTNPALDNALCASWAASTVNDGTPGAQNSTWIDLGGAPVISDVAHDPAAPSYLDEVTVTATITDNGLVMLAQLEVVVDGGTPAAFPMAGLGGDLYGGLIAAQASGSVVEYRVTALDDDGNFAESAWAAYTVAAGTVDIVINELHYNGPETGTDVTEFLELYNNGTATVSLEGWILTGVTYSFPAGVALVPGQYLVVAGNADGFTAFYGFAPDLVWTGGALSNDGEAIVLSNAAGAEMDRVVYDDGGNWPSGPDGNGPSLELIDPDLDNLLYSNWQASYVAGGTPGAANSTMPVEAEEQPGLFALHAAWPNPFNPQTTLSFSLAQTQAIRLSVFDAAGRTVATLHDGLAEAGEHQLVFQARGLASGVYFAMLEGGGRISVQRLTLIK